MISAVVTNPVAQPACENNAYRGVSNVPFGSAFTAPFTTRDPLPHADEAAEESVTAEFSERVFMTPIFAPGSSYRLIHVSGRFRVSCEKRFAHVSVPTLMPSLTI